MNLDNLFKYDWERTGLELKAGALAAREHGKTTDEEYNASEKMTRKVIGKFYGYEKFGWDKDRFEGVLERYNLSLGVGNELLSMEKDKLILEAGAGYISEERPDQVDAFASGRLYGKYTRTLSQTAIFSQDAEYLHSFKNADDYRLNAETALVVSVTARVSLKTFYKWKRIAKPAPGFIKDDTLTGLALIVNY